MHAWTCDRAKDDHRDDQRHLRSCRGHLRLVDLGSHRDRQEHPCRHRDLQGDQRIRRHHRDGQHHLGQLDHDFGIRQGRPDVRPGHRDHWNVLDRPDRQVADLDHWGGCLDWLEHPDAPGASRASCLDLDEGRLARQEHSARPVDPCRWSRQRGCCPDEERPDDPCRWSHRRGCCPDEVQLAAEHLAAELPGLLELLLPELSRPLRRLRLAVVPELALPAPGRVPQVRQGRGLQAQLALEQRPPRPQQEQPALA